MANILAQHHAHTDDKVVSRRRTYPGDGQRAGKMHSPVEYGIEFEIPTFGDDDIFTTGYNSEFIYNEAVHKKICLATNTQSSETNSHSSKYKKKEKSIKGEVWEIIERLLEKHSVKDAVYYWCPFDENKLVVLGQGVNRIKKLARNQTRGTTVVFKESGPLHTQQL